MSMDQLPIINIAAGAATSVIGSVAGYEKGQAEKAAADYNASMTIQTMQQEEAASEQKFGAIMGQQRAMYGAAGVDISQPPVNLGHLGASHPQASAACTK